MKFDSPVVKFECCLEKHAFRVFDKGATIILSIPVYDLLKYGV